MKIILFFETQIGDSIYTIKVEENKEENIYCTTMKQVDYKGNVIDDVCATYVGSKIKALNVAYNEIKSIIC